MTAAAGSVAVVERGMVGSRSLVSAACCRVFAAGAAAGTSLCCGVRCDVCACEDFELYGCRKGCEGTSSAQ